MAIALIMEFHGGTLEQYDAVVEALELNGHLARGGIFHVAGPIEDGVRIVDVWESQQAVDTFLLERLGPVTERLKIVQPQVTVWPVHNIMSEPYAG